MLIEFKDVIWITFGALVIFLLARLPNFRTSQALMDRSSQNALVSQLTTLQQEVNEWRERALAAEARLSVAEARITQLQSMIDNLLPASVNDKQVLAAYKSQLQERNQELDTLKAGLGIR